MNLPLRQRDVRWRLSTASAMIFSDVDPGSFRAERGAQACRRTLELEVVDVVRVHRMFERLLEHQRKEASGQLRLAPILRPRFARDP